MPRWFIDPNVGTRAHASVTNHSQLESWRRWFDWIAMSREDHLLVFILRTVAGHWSVRCVGRSQAARSRPTMAVIARRGIVRVEGTHRQPDAPCRKKLMPPCTHPSHCSSIRATSVARTLLRSPSTMAHLPIGGRAHRWGGPKLVSVWLVWVRKERRRGMSARVTSVRQWSVLNL
jgi:hypothetical protein